MIKTRTRLHELAEKYGVDKLHSHSYIPIYEAFFEGRTMRRVLEIGIGFEQLMKPFVPFYRHAASLHMWADFWPEAEIYACDIRPDTLVNEGRIRSVLCNQSYPEELKKMSSDFGYCWDFICDDGSHVTNDQIVTAETLIPHLMPDGIYVIEDVQEPDRIVRELGRGDILRFDKRPDDCLVVFRA